ncbi:MAG: NAD(P)H-dependent oxidoreductase subunit E [Deltaproteobacteria bacterium]|nr:NAD(P)H-dependent oxidoreductase subunit E [Deltaproteobacteria bacterium]
MTAAPATDIKSIDKILARHPRSETAALVNILHDLQAEFGFLAEKVLRRAAVYIGVPQVQLFRVVTFYEGFHLKPRGKHICTVCVGTACHVRGASKLVDHIERQFKVRVGNTTNDMQLTLESVNCVGACALGPLVMIDGSYHGNMSASKLDKILKPLKRK